MIIKALTIENFKGIREPVRVEFKPITLLFGPNSAGKSTIIQALHYMREILERNNVDADFTMNGGGFVDLGGFLNFVNAHDISCKIRIKVEVDLERTDLPTYHDPVIEEYVEGPTISECDLNPYLTSAAVELTVSWSEFFRRPYVSKYSTWINNELFASITATPDEKRIEVSEINFDNSLFVVGDEEPIVENSGIQLWGLYEYVTGKSYKEVQLYLKGQKNAVPKWGQELDFGQNVSISEMENYPYHSEGLTDRQLFAIMSQLLVGPGEIVCDELKNFRYLGPIREVPPRCYEAPRFEEAGRWSSGLGAWDLLSSSDETFAQEVTYWMDEGLDTGYQVGKRYFKEIETTSKLYSLLVSGNILDAEDDIAAELLNIPEKKQLFLHDTQRKLDVLPQDVGIGVSQVLPVVVSAIASNQMIVAIEQPELHIHPKIQVRLGDLFIWQLQEGERTFILETHSEHLLLRLLRRIRETSDGTVQPELILTPDQVGIYYVEKGDDSLTIRQLLISPDGDSLGEWPKGFFEERAEELL